MLRLRLSWRIITLGAATGRIAILQNLVAVRKTLQDGHVKVLIGCVIDLANPEVFNLRLANRARHRQFGCILHGWRTNSHDHHVALAEKRLSKVFNLRKRIYFRMYAEGGLIIGHFVVIPFGHNLPAMNHNRPMAMIHARFSGNEARTVA